MYSAVITATGLYTPPNSISNQELVDSFNQYVDEFNAENSDKIAAGEVEALLPSSTAFIEKASGIKNRFVLEKEGILDTKKMSPELPERSNDEMSLMCEMAVKAATEALKKANLAADAIDLVIVAASNMERAYPAMAVEIQAALGCSGYAFDMNVACSSATFGIKTAADAICSGSANKVLMVNPEICSAQLNYRDRDCHFIFSDICTAVILERQDDAQERGCHDCLKIESFKLLTQFSNNIRNNFGFIKRSSKDPAELLFKQQGRKVFKEVVPVAAQLITDLLGDADVSAESIKCYWLHQANINMNQLIIKKVLGYLPEPVKAPLVLDSYANTGSAGSIIAMHKYHDHFEPGDYGVLCSFGAGYSAGAILLKKL